MYPDFAFRFPPGCVLLLAACVGALAPVALGQTSSGASAVAQAPACDVMPLPARLQFGAGRLAVTEGFTVTLDNHVDPRLEAGVARALARWQARTGLTLPHAHRGAGPATLTISCEGPGLAVPAVDENESYTLEITPERAALKAPTAVGALRGLETLLQLLRQEAQGFYLPAVTIVDQPRFAWRGLMIDVVRHWQPIEVIKRNLDAMAVVKLNVLHLHLTDDQGIRVESKRFPELAAKASGTEFFTQDQIRDLIAYATDRGIRVVPEFDLPAHGHAWVVSHPEFASAPGPYEPQVAWASVTVLDVTNEALYPFLDAFFGEMAALFPDAYIHIGGDENNGRQWNANPKIQAYIREHGLKDNHGLQTWFNQRVTKILTAHGKRIVGWDEIQHRDLPKTATIHAWRGLGRLNDAARAGYTAILSNGYYIDLANPAAIHYRVDPLPVDTRLNAEEQARVLGGEATMWAEWVSPETIDSRIWPRTAAIAERFWSPREVNDVADMYRRLGIVSARLSEAGARHEANYEIMLRRLCGVELTNNEFQALRRFADALEPVKQRLRGRLQKINQDTPLTGLVDCARIESVDARAFAISVQGLLANRSGLTPAAIEPLSRQLGAWHASARVVADTLAPRCARLQDVKPVAQELGALCEIGQVALNALAANRKTEPAIYATQLDVLDRASVSGPAALELPMVAAIRALVQAAH